jgi:hypothetical protein
MTVMLAVEACIAHLVKDTKRLGNSVCAWGFRLFERGVAVCCRGVGTSG